MTWATILSIVTALAFTGAAAANAFDWGGTAQSFCDWGYPRQWRFVTAAIEVAGAAMLIVPETRAAGMVLLGAVIVGAILTLLRVRAGAAHLAPTIGFAVLLAAAGVVAL